MNRTTNLTAPTRIAIAALARHFDEQRADKTALAEQLREDDSAYYPEYAAIAAAYEDAATTAWAMIGGCPPAAMAEPKHSRISIDLRELGKLVEMATRPLYTMKPEPTVDIIVEEDTRLVERTLQLLRNRVKELAKGHGVVTTERVLNAIDTYGAATVSETKRSTNLRRQALDEINRMLDDAKVPRDGQLTANRVRLLIDERDVLMATQPTTKPCEFGEALLERLATAYGKAFSEAFAAKRDNACGEGVRAILSELASMPCELPMTAEIERVIKMGYEIKQYDAEETADMVIELLNTHLTPILIAKNTTITRQAKALLARDEQIAALKARTPANSCTDSERAQYELTIEQQKAKIAKLDTQFHARSPANVDDAARMKALCFDEQTWEQRAHEMTRPYRMQIAELEASCKNRANACEHWKKAERTAISRIVELEMRIADLKKHAATLVGLARQYKSDRDHVEETCRIQRERIDALESRTPANECANAERTQYEITIEQQKARIAELEAELLAAGEWFSRNAVPTHKWKGAKLTLLQRIENLMAEHDDTIRHFDSFMKEETLLRTRITELDRTIDDLAQSTREARAELTSYVCAINEALQHAGAPVTNNHSNELSAIERIAWMKADAEDTMEKWEASTRESTAKIAELEAERDAWNSDALSCHMVLAAIRDHFGLTPQWNNAQWSELLPRIKNHLAVGDKLAIDGKTPGEFGYGVWYQLCRRGLSMALRDWKTDVSARDKQIWETTCTAVLRAFSLAMLKQAVAEALGRVRKRIYNASIPQCHVECNHKHILWDEALAVIDAEIAKLDAPKDLPINAKGSTPVHTAHDAFVAELETSTSTPMPSDDLQRLRDRVLAMGENQTAAQFKEYVLAMIDDLSGHASLAPNELR